MNYNEIKEILAQHNIRCRKGGNGRVTAMEVFRELSYDDIIKKITELGLLEYITIIDNGMIDRYVTIDFILNIYIYDAICQYSILEKDLNRVETESVQKFIKKQMRNLKDIIDNGGFNITVQDAQKKLQDYKKRQNDLSIKQLQDEIAKKQAELEALTFKLGGQNENN